MRKMRLPVVLPGAFAVLLQAGDASAQVRTWQFGGGGGKVWSEFADTIGIVLADDFTNPSALQPRELDPEVNILPHLGPWHGYKYPQGHLYRDGQPRIWRGVNNTWRWLFFPLTFVDGDPGTANVFNPLIRTSQEYYTLDLGGRVPAERFRFYPPDGIDHITDVPYRPNYVPVGFELSATSDAGWIVEEGISETGYNPLEHLLFTTRQHYEPSGVVDIEFPLQYQRFFRIRAFPESVEICIHSGIHENWRGECIRRLAWAEMEVYGRGFVPEATWESLVVDLEGEFSFGRVLLWTSRWRRTEEGLLEPAPGSPARAEVELRTGNDEDPTAWFGYNSRGGHVQVTAEEFEGLRVNRPEIDPKEIGWRGPVAHDHENWSFWSSPAADSGSRPRVGTGRYFQTRVRLYTDRVWEFARLDSLAIEYSPLLADRIIAEIAGIDNLRPDGNLTKVLAGERTEFVYDLVAEFSGEKPGFDAVRLFTPSEAEFLSLQMGDPLLEAVPEEVVEEESGFTLYLPRRVAAGEPPMRIELATALYGASGTFGGEVFERGGEGLPQTIEAGDVSDAVGTNRMQVVAFTSSLGGVVGAVEVDPPVFTPQGDGVNDRVRIGYSMMRVQGEVEVEVGLFSLSGERVWHRRSGTGAGRHSVSWEGRDDQGRPVPPGLYLARVKVATSEGDFERLQRVAVVY